MDKEVLKQRILRQYRPKARPMPEGKAKQLLAKFGQVYQPAKPEDSPEQG